ncbi:MAG: radical SAM family heme chaperone HemW [Legionellales bacterium]|nr:radical SAM family heme chaperone HemW [Legionellales bacterium]
MLPLSLYIHIPWCLRKCPYCDFNSHLSPGILPENRYVDALVADLKQDLEWMPARPIHSIFIGGGTPSLFSAAAFESLFYKIQALLPFAPHIEITLEANPGTVEQQRFTEYRALGINRLSLGIQSFNDLHLKRLGRIHDASEAHRAIDSARGAGFDNLNLDLMHGLPEQSIQQGLDDLNMAMTHQPEHLSWYQLTLEPNTVFYKTQPLLPCEDELDQLEQEGFTLLAEKGFQRYEISAFHQANLPSRHNLNYWLFGDYLGIGAGAHGKGTDPLQKVIYRTRKQRQPNDYLNPSKPALVEKKIIDPSSLIFEFMLNTTRLQQPIPNTLFTERTARPFDELAPFLLKAQTKGLITLQPTHWQVTPFGRQFTNDLQAIFLPD